MVYQGLLYMDRRLVLLILSRNYIQILKQFCGNSVAILKVIFLEMFDQSQHFSHKTYANKYKFENLIINLFLFLT